MVATEAPGTRDSVPGRVLSLFAAVTYESKQVDPEACERAYTDRLGFESMAGDFSQKWLFGETAVALYRDS